MSLRIARRFWAPLLSGGLLVGICQLGTLTLFAQFVPVGPPVPVNVGNLSNPAPGAIPPLAPAPAQVPAVQLGRGYEGVTFLASNCNCLPPDTNAAVGNNFVVETVNVQLRIYDKTTGAHLLDEPLAALFGASTGGDPYVLYDDLADRWYVSAFDTSDTGLFLAVSSDGNPLHAFHTFHFEHLGEPDYEKPGFNKDAIFISYNDFGPGGGAAATILSINKATALSGGSLIFGQTIFKSVPKFQFRAMPPAQMHGDTTGGVEWFVSTDGTDASGTTMRVTRMTNYLSNAPLFTYTSLPVEPYKNAPRADQPGGSVTTFPNTTTTQVQYHHGHLVTAMASGIGRDGFVYPKGLFFQIDVTGTAPTLIKQGVIDPGTGVAVQMPSVDEDQSGNLGFTWMESSTTEFLSMWVGALDTSGALSASVAAPGGGFFPANIRIGDYSTTVLDPSDHQTFFSANEYIGNDGFNNIWLTHIRAFTAKPTGSEFVYVANGGSSNVSGYTINPTTGALTAISGSPFAAGSQPAFVAVDPTGKFAYVTNIGALHGTVSGYTIDPTTGALTPISGSPFAAAVGPASVAVDPTGKFAYVANIAPFPGSVSGNTIDPTTGALTAISGSPFATGFSPVSVAVDPTGKFAYVANEGSNNVSGYTIDPTTGALTPISGSPFAGPPFSLPTSVTVYPTGKFVYVANENSNNVSGYRIDATTGALTPISGSPFAAGSGPFSVVVDPTGRFAYVANSNSLNVSGYTIDPTTGALTPISGSPFATAVGPASVAVDPTGKFAYVANEGSGNVSGYTIDPTTGALTPISGSPFAAGTQPLSVAVARPH